MSWLDDQKKRAIALAMSAGRNFRDVFDANTASDQAKRLAAGQPRYYQQQQAQNRSVNYGTNPMSQVFNRGRDIVDANTAQDRQRRIQQGRAELEQKTFQAKYAPFLKPAKLAWDVSTANPIMNPLGFAMKATQGTSAHKVVGGVDEGIKRSLVGTGQSLSGLVDLASPGTGQSSVTKLLNNTAEGIDQTVKNKGYSTIPYRGAQVATDIATFLVPGTQGAKIGKALEKGSKFVPKGSQAFQQASKAIATANQTLDKGGKLGKVGKFYLKPENLIDIGVDTGLNTGMRSSRGEDVSASTLAQDAGLSTLFAGGIGGAAYGGKKLLKHFFNEREISKIAKSTDVEEIRNSLNMKYPNLNKYDLDQMARDLVNKNTKQDVKGALEEAIIKDSPNTTPTTEPTETTTPTDTPKQTNTQATTEPQIDVNTAVKTDATAIKQRYPQLDEATAKEITHRLDLAKTPEEKAKIELEAKARNDAVQEQITNATEAPVVSPTQENIQADTAVMNDSTADIAAQEVKSAGEPNTQTMKDLQSVGVSLDDLDKVPLAEPKKNPVLEDLILATDELKKEGIPDNIIKKAMDDPNAPLAAAEFKNYVRRLANTETTVDQDLIAVQKAMMDAYARGDTEMANLLNDSLKESGNNVLNGPFPGTPQVGKTVETPAPKPIEKVAEPQGVESFTNMYQAIDPAKNTPQVNAEIKSRLQAKAQADLAEFDAILRQDGHSLDEFGDAIDQSRKRNTKLPAWVEEYAPIYRQYTDELRALSGDKIGKRDLYIPEARPLGPNAQMINDGATVTAAIDQQFTFGNKNRNLIPYEELDTPTNRWHRYFDQLINEKFKLADEANKPQYANFVDENGNSTAFEYITNKHEIARRIWQQTDPNSKVKRKDAWSGDLVIDQYRDNYIKNNPTAKVNKIDKTFAVTDNLREKRGAFQKLDFYDDSGIRQIDQANTVAANIHDKDFADINTMTPEQIKAKINSIYADVYNDNPSAKQLILDKLYNDILYEKRNSEALGEISVSLKPFSDAEKSLAREKLLYNIERTEFTNPEVKKWVNKQVVRALAGNRMREALGEKISRQLTSTLYSSLIALKPSTAFQNLTESSRTVGLVGPKYSAKAAALLSSGKVNGKDILKKHGQDLNFIRQSTGQADNVKGNKFERGRDKVNFLFNATESSKDAHMLLALELKFADEFPNATGREIGEKVAKAYTAAFKGGQFGTLKGAEGAIGNAFYQFTQYPIKDIKMTGKYLDMALHGNRKGEAMKYLAGNFGTKAAMMAVTWPLFGWSAQQMMGANAPKAGPLVSLPLGVLTAINDEIQRLEETGEQADWSNLSDKSWQTIYDNVGRKFTALPIPGGDYLNSTGTLTWLANQISDDWTPFQKDGTIQEMQRGYGVNKEGLPRIPGQESAFGKFKQIIGGKYNSNEAKQYFGQTPWSFKVDLPGDKLDINIGQKLRGKPLTKLERDEFAKLSTKKERNEYIRLRDSKNRETRTRWADLEKSNPDVAATRDALQYVKMNKDTHKLESDVISPQKWSMIASEQSGKLFENLAIDKRNMAKDMGIPFDPIFDGSLTAQQRNEILALRSMNTGDDYEKKGTLKTAQWYQDFAKKERDYYEALNKKGFKEDPDSKYGLSKRAKDYIALGAQNPDSPANRDSKYTLVAKYYSLKDSNKDAAKQYYKNNADKLGAEFEALANERYDWINKRRALEGVGPLALDVYKNASYGYEPDEAKLASELYFKNGKYSGYTKFRSNGSQDSQDKDYKLYLSELLANDKNAKPISSLKINTTAKRVKMKSYAPKAVGKIKRIRIK